MAKRRPQVNFQVSDAMKVLYEEAREQGHWVTRFCAAGFLLMVEDPAARMKAIRRLREWEAQFDQASEDDVRAFVEGAQAALEQSAQDSQPTRRARAGRKKAKRG